MSVVQLFDRVWDRQLHTLEKVLQAFRHIQDLRIRHIKTKQDMQYYHSMFSELIDYIEEGLEQIKKDRKVLYGETGNNAGEQESSIPRNPKKE